MIFNLKLKSRATDSQLKLISENNPEIIKEQIRIDQQKLISKET